MKQMFKLHNIATELCQQFEIRLYKGLIPNDNYERYRYLDCGVIKNDRLDPFRQFMNSKTNTKGIRNIEVNINGNDFTKMNCSIIGMIYKLRNIFLIKSNTISNNNNNDIDSDYATRQQQLGYFMIGMIHNIKPINDVFIMKFVKSSQIDIFSNLGH